MAQIGWQHLQACCNILYQGGPTQQIKLREIHREASLHRHPVRGRRYNKEGTGPQAVSLCQTHSTELLQRSLKGTDVPPRTLKSFQYVGERLPKGVIPRLHLYVFPPTTTETRINSWLEVITPTGEGGK